MMIAEGRKPGTGPPFWLHCIMWVKYNIISIVLKVAFSWLGVCLVVDFLKVSRVPIKLFESFK